ncbi:argininosuccinate lyase [compost metagenome]
MRQSIIFVESGNRAEEIPVITGLGFNVIFVSSGMLPYDEHNFNEDSKCIVDKGIVQYDRLAEIVKELHGLFTIRTIISTSDYFVHSVSLLCEQYRYPSLNSISASIFQNKNRFREKQQELQYAAPEFHCFDSLQDAVNFYQSSKKKQWVFKPINGNESVAVRLINSESELNDCYRQLKYLSRYTGTLLMPSFLLEEFIEGCIYSCEFMVSAGHLHILGVTNRLMSQLPYFIELGYSFPVRGFIADLIIEETKRFVKDFQYDFGPCHIEFIVSPDRKIYILEVNPRLIGPPNPWMIDKALGISVFEIVCKLYIFGGLVEAAYFDSKYSTCLEVISPVSGQLGRVKIDMKYLNRSDVKIIYLKKEMAYVNRAASNTDIVARILTVAESIDEARQLALTIYESIRLELCIKPVPLTMEREDDINGHL